MILKLFHGRRTKNEELDGWGFAGPELKDVQWFHTTYGSDLKMSFKSLEARDAAIEATGWKYWRDDLDIQIPLVEDMIQTKDGYFGDWSAYDPDPTQISESIHVRALQERIHALNRELGEAHAKLRSLRETLKI